MAGRYYAPIELTRDFMDWSGSQIADHVDVTRTPTIAMNATFRRGGTATGPLSAGRELVFGERVLGPVDGG